MTLQLAGAEEPRKGPTTNKQFLLIMAVFLFVGFNFTWSRKKLQKLNVGQQNATFTAVVANIDDSSSTYYSCNLSETASVQLPKMVPHFIIIGAQKAGTTALHNMLKNVPGVVSTQKREAHFFDWINPNKQYTSYEKCQLHQRYARMLNFKKGQDPSNVKSFEKTPSYVAHPKIAKLIPTILPHKPKIILVLRNPIARAYSHYKMTWQSKGEWKFSRKNAKKPKGKRLPSFERIVQMETTNYIHRGYIHAPFFTNATNKTWNPKEFYLPLNDTKEPQDYMPTVLRGFYAAQIRHWMKVFSINVDFKIIPYEVLNHNKSGILQDLLNFVGAPPHNLTKAQLDKDYSPNKKNGAFSYPPMTNETNIYLQHFYKPLNDDLADLLGEEWRGIWD